jgi:capsule biosynthesis phosphatase
MISIDGNWYKGRLVFDFDGVICVFGAKDYSQAVPYEISINHINRVFTEGWHITICTARYMMRCNGNIQDVNRFGYDEAYGWLRKFKVNFHKLVLGKPSADMYIDDRACRIEGSKGDADWQNTFWPLLNKIEEANANLRI